MYTLAWLNWHETCVRFMWQTRMDWSCKPSGFLLMYIKPVDYFSVCQSNVQKLTWEHTETNSSVCKQHIFCWGGQLFPFFKIVDTPLQCFFSQDMESRPLFLKTKKAWTSQEDSRSRSGRHGSFFFQVIFWHFVLNPRGLCIDKSWNFLTNRSKPSSCWIFGVFVEGASKMTEEAIIRQLKRHFLRLKEYAIYPHFSYKSTIHASKYTSPMDPMGVYTACMGDLGDPIWT